MSCLNKKKSLKSFITQLRWLEPVELFKKIDLPYHFFLDSASASGEINKNSRWSYLSYSPPKIIFKSYDGVVEITTDGKTKIELTKNPIVLLERLLNSRPPADIKSKIPFAGGAVGYFSYEFSRHFENVPNRIKQKFPAPLSYFLFFDKFIAFDHYKKKSYLVILGSQKNLKAVASKEKKNILNLLKNKNSAKNFQARRCRSNFNLKSFSKAVNKVKKYIKEGDIFQANIAQRWQCDFTGDTKSVYLKLRKINPSPYSCYLKFPELEIISCSPELLVRRNGNLIETRPIAGTRRRGKDCAEDNLLTKELLLDEKERAEHIMLVDLERNDLGKISKFNTVKISENMVLEKYSHVSHIVSNIQGILKKNVSVSEIIKSVFPGGTITGCPKIRSIEIIDEIEPVERGPYCGSAGWISYNKNLQLNILIRTMIRIADKLFFYAGAGIVADSIPRREYRETIHKASAMAESLNLKFYHLPSSRHQWSKRK